MKLHIIRMSISQIYYKGSQMDFQLILVKRKIKLRTLRKKH